VVPLLLVILPHL